VGYSPITAAFDGVNVWVVNGGDGATGSVSKLRAGDGKVLGTFTVGNSPTGIAFDGANMWIANRGDGTVSKLRASDGENLGTFAVPLLPYGVAFDGVNIWLTTDEGVTELGEDGAVLYQINIEGGATGVAFDGADLWLAEFGKNAIGKL
jgi:DNA-binding beta-propeller fold protein YncE